MTSANKITLTILSALLFVASTASADDWPQWRGPQRDGVWREAGIVDKFPGETLERRWSVPIAGGYSGPTVADGRVYVSDRVDEPEEIERVHCFDWKSGKPLWSHSYACSYREVKYQAGPRASVLIDDGLAYSLGSAGHLYCFDATKGKVVWKRDLHTEYKIRMPDWGISASPVVDANLLIVQIGGKDACLVAFDKKSGEERWKALADEASYSAPLVVGDGAKRLLICWTGERIVGLEPQTGKLRWAFPFRYEKWPIAIADPVPFDERILFSEAHKGSLLLRRNPNGNSVDEVWHQRGEGNRSTKALHCLQSTPAVVGDHAYGIDNQGVLRCLDLANGQQVWQDERVMPRARWATGYMVRNGQRFWIFNERGELIIANLTPKGYEEISRAKLIDPTTEQLRRRGGVTWSHPAFAYKHVFARNDKELVCVDLTERPRESGE